MRTLRIFAKCVLGLVLSVAVGQGETVRCTAINALPATIDHPGIYCLSKNLNCDLTEGDAILIQASNVVLDLNGWKLMGSRQPTGNLRGISSLEETRDITVKNGTVSGFQFGISLRGDKHVVEGVRVERSTEGGIEGEGDANIIRNNQVVGVGGSELAAWGIYVDGRGIAVINNDISDINGPGGIVGSGILLSNFSGSGGDCLVVNNRITHTSQGIVFNADVTGKYRDNLTSGVTTPYIGGTDAGNNN